MVLLLIYTRDEGISGVMGLLLIDIEGEGKLSS